MKALMCSGSNSIAEVPQNQGAGSKKCLEETYLFLCPEKMKILKNP